MDSMFTVILMASGQLPYPVVFGLYILMAVMVSTSIPVIVITRMLKRGNTMSEDIVSFEAAFFYHLYVHRGEHLKDHGELLGKL